MNSTAALITVYVTVPVLTVLNWTLSLGLMLAHWQQPQEPVARRRTLQVLAMVPLFGLTTLCSTVWPGQFLYFDLVRESYEAWVLWQFHLLLLHYLHRLGPAALGVSATFDHKNKCRVDTDYIMDTTEKLFVELPPQRLFCMQLHPSVWLLTALRLCVLQYCVLRALLPPLMIALFELGLYGNRQPNAQGGYVWLALLCTLSVSVVLCALVVLIKLTQPVIWRYAPTTKLVAIKLIVFCIFWQSLLLSAAAYVGAVPPDLFNAAWPLDQTTEVLQSALLSFELAWLALYHYWIFVAEEPQLVSTVPLCAMSNAEFI
jgi:hypothetical protein